MADISALKKKLDQDPDSMAFAPLADAYRKDGQLDEAETVCVEGLKRHPAYVAGRLILARIYADKEKFLESASVAQSVIKMDGENLLAHALMWQALIKLGRFPDAAKVIQRHLSLNPTDPEAKRAMDEVTVAMAAPPPAEVPAAPEASVATPPSPKNGPPPPPGAKTPDPAPAKSKAGGSTLPPPPPVPLSLGGIKKEAGVQAGINANASPNVNASTNVSASIAAGQADNLLKVADLYLKKGQAEKAEDAYGEVLLLDPGNKLAQAGLEEARSKKVPVATAKMDEAPVPPLPVPKSQAPAESEILEKEFDSSAFEDKEPTSAPPPVEKKVDSTKLDFSAFEDPEPEASKPPVKAEAAVEPSPPPPPAAPEPPPAAEEPKPTAAPALSSEAPDLIPVLEGINRTSGIIGSMIVGIDGNVVAKAFNVDLETEALMRMVGTIFENTQKSVDRMKQGTLSQVMITAMHGQIFLNSTGRGILTILATEKVKIGILRLAINEAVKKISKE